MKALKPHTSIIWLFVIWPLAQLAYGFYQVQYAGNIFFYGPEPAKAVVHNLGLWAMGFLFLVLATRHIKSLLNLMPYRRRLGLAAFFYAVMHLLAYAALILGFELGELISEIKERPYILVGLASILCMLPMAVTSTKGWQKRLKHKWKTLHMLVYPAAILVLIHLWWQVRAGFLLAASMTALIAIIFILRFLPNWLAQRQTSSNL